MCRAAYLYNLEPKTNNNIFGIILNYTLNSYKVGNKDGNFIQIDGESFRTLDFKEFVKHLIDNKEKINNSREICLHLRFSTNTKGKDWIHGWEVGGYSCYHNGVIQITGKTIENDSYDFFQSVALNSVDVDDLVNNIDIELNNRTGSGAFFMIGKGNSLIFSKEHLINIHLINRSLIVINSNDDIHKLKKDVKLECLSSVSAWGLEFNVTKSRKIDTGLEIKEDLINALYNGLIKIESGEVKEYINFDFPKYQKDYSKDYSTDWDWRGYEKEAHYENFTG